MNLKVTFVGLGLLLGMAGCTHDPDVIGPDGPDGPVGSPKPYALPALPSRFPPFPAQPADNPLTEPGVALGRKLFYETALSVDNTISCGTCHRQELAFTDGRAHAVGVNQGRTLRSAMSLANVIWEPILNWDGAAKTLENQARIPIEHPAEMHQSLTIGAARLQQIAAYPALFRSAFGSSTITEDNVLKALAQFERTLISTNSRFDRFRAGDRTALSSFEQDGYQLFITHPEKTLSLRGGNCGDCHSGELQTNGTFSNNGLDATLTDLGLGTQTGRPTDNGKFRVPSLRNIGLTAPYMHDGRFATLEQVLDHYNEHVKLNSPNLDPQITNGTNDPRLGTLGLTTLEKAKIVAFLHTLTDSTFIRDPRFSKP